MGECRGADAARPLTSSARSSAPPPCRPQSGRIACGALAEPRSPPDHQPGERLKCAREITPAQRGVGNIVLPRRGRCEIVILVGCLNPMTGDKQKDAVALGPALVIVSLSLARMSSRLASASRRSVCETISTEVPALSCSALRKRAASLPANRNCWIVASS